MADDLLNEFIAESREHLATIEADLLTIEEMGADIDEQLVNKVFRAAHSIKGGSGFFGLNRIKELAHRAETILDMIRSGKIAPNAEITNILLIGFDALRELINNAEASDTIDVTVAMQSLEQLTASYLPASQKKALAEEVDLSPADGTAPVRLQAIDIERARETGRHIYLLEMDLMHDIERKGKNILRVFEDLYATGEIVDFFPDLAAVGTLDGPISNTIPMKMVFSTVIEPDLIEGLIEIPSDRIQTLFAPTPQAPPAESTPPRPDAGVAVRPAVAPPEPPPAPRERKSEQEAAQGDGTLRVSVTLLESLMNLAGELVLSRNQLREALSHNDGRAVSVSSQRINLVTSEIQDAIMQTRMQPIGNVFGKFPRVVRDMARTLGKEIELDLRGKDVGLDKSLIEGLSDPLTHMVRNSADHGIESPQERVRNGKKAVGTIRLEARHEAGQVVIEIADDGKGIDPDRVASGAIARGLLSPDAAARMTEKEKINLIFLPGLSTAEKVTDVSGRGVGMDVVKTNLDRLGGKIEIDSAVGKGSTFRIKLPLTLAIIPSLIVRIGAQRYAIPQVSIVELLRIPVGQIRKRIDVVGDAEVLLLRDQILPLLWGADMFTGGADGADGRGKESHDLEIAVVTTGGTLYGLVVDAFFDSEEIVVKPLGRHIKKLGEYAGATIMGDGTVALILDTAGLAAKASLRSVDSGSSLLSDDGSAGLVSEQQSLLTFYNGRDELCATPLGAVLRIESISADQVETFGGRRTMKYRGSSLPLVTLADAASMQPLDGSRGLAVIVSKVHGKEVGLLGAMPVDVVETSVAIDTLTHRQPGVAGSAIIGNRTVLLADVHELTDAVYPLWRSGEPARSGSPESVPAPAESVAAPIPDSGGGTAPGGQVIVLAEDSDFFRAQVKRYLSEEGFTVLDAPDGEAAWEVLSANANRASMVVTDVEMPRLTGLGLARRIRADGRFAGLPVIGLSSLAGDGDTERALEAGISEYLVKLDRERLIESVRRLMAPAIVE
jgi:two-component system, chemotaxis family, sensor kinase CheA